MTDNKMREEDRKGLQELLTNMDATIYRLNLLCNRFEKDKDTILKENLELKKAIKNLQEETMAFGEIRSEVDTALTKKIDEASGIIAAGVNDKIQEMVTNDVREAISRLGNILNHTEKKMVYFHRLDVRRIIYMALGILIVPMLGGISTARLFMSDPMMIFDKSTCEVYKSRCAYIKK